MEDSYRAAKKDCKDKKQCDTKHYLYGNENDTTARTWGWLHGKVKDNGDFVCTVYAIKELKYNEKMVNYNKSLIRL
ncbi:hypothetical protein K9E45_05490 [Gardnerella vaginalis]|nr:hypothetical protein K9E45_05490 [Gardnerella vaginalis]